MKNYLNNKSLDKQMKKLFIFLLLGMFLISFASSTNYFVLDSFLSNGGNADVDEAYYGFNYKPTTSFNITNITLQRYQVNIPGNANISIYATNATGFPTGSPLETVIIQSTGGFNNVWRNVTYNFSGNTVLAANTNYTIVMGYFGTSYWRWSIDQNNPTIPSTFGAGFFLSTNGSSWTFFPSGGQKIGFNVGIYGGFPDTIISNGTFNTTAVNSSWEENANLTFYSGSPTSNFFSWLVNGVEKLSGIGQNIFNYVFNLPSNSPNATVNLLNSGISYYQCLQESANVSNQTGKDGSCGQNYNGTYQFSGSWTSPGQLYDGLNSTIGVCGSGTCDLYINYTRPNATVNSINLSVYTDVTVGENYTIPSSCNYGSKLQLNYKAVAPTNGSFYCFNSSSMWQLIYTQAFLIYIGEEKIWWNTSIAGSLLSNETFNINTNSTNPIITINSGNTLADYANSTTNHTVNYTVSDTNLQTCELAYGFRTNTTQADDRYMTNISGYSPSVYAPVGYIYIPNNASYKFRIVAPITADVTPNIRVYYNKSNESSYWQFDVNGQDGYQNIEVPDTGWHLVTWRPGSFGPSIGRLDLFSVNDTYFITAINRIPCTNNLQNSTNFTLINGENSAFILANDSVSNSATQEFSWNYKVFEINQTYQSHAQEGSAQNFSAIIDLDSNYSIASVRLNYSGNASFGSFRSSGNYTEIFIENYIIPQVSSNQTKSFYWRIDLNDSSVVNLSTQSQLISPLLIDNCSNYTNKLFNISIYDQDTLLSLPNATINIDVSLYSVDRSQLVASLGINFTNQTNVGVCVDSTILNNSAYSTDAVIQFYAPNYANQYYNIQRYILNSSNSGQNISLYDLNSSYSTNFQLVFTGSNYLPESGVLVFVNRQYVGQNVFRTVEVPKTDANGQTVLHLVNFDGIYNFVFMKDGIVLKQINGVQAFCQNLYQVCTLSLNSISTDSNTLNYNQKVGIVYSTGPTYNSSTGLVSFSYTSTDGESKTVLLSVERSDVFGNRTICTNTVSSISGTVSCNVGDATDGNFETVISVNGVESIFDTLVGTATSYGNYGYILWFLLTLGLLLMASKDKNLLILALLFSYAGAIGIGIAVGGIIGISSAGIWIVIISFAALWKINKNKFA